MPEREWVNVSAGVWQWQAGPWFAWVERKRDGWHEIEVGTTQNRDFQVKALARLVPYNLENSQKLALERLADLRQWVKGVADIK